MATATWVTRWEVDSMTTDKVYTVAQKEDGSFGCDCPAWRFHKAPRPDCKHILKIKQKETARTNAPTSVNLSSRRAGKAAASRVAIAQAVRGGNRVFVPSPAAPPAAAPIFIVQTRRRISLED